MAWVETSTITLTMTSASAPTMASPMPPERDEELDEECLVELLLEELLREFEVVEADSKSLSLPACAYDAGKQVVKSKERIIKGLFSLKSIILILYF